MKTLREWFNECLPKEVAEKAIKNTVDQIGEMFLDDTFSSIQGALVSSFTWSLTPEKSDYWNKIYESI